MPRACFPNARFLANADSPLLPLLAPRAFAEAPFPRRSKRRDGRTAQKVQETENNDGKYGDTAMETGSPEGAGSAWGGACRLKLARGSVSGLLQAPKESSNARVLKRSLDLRYADIFSFARQQLRGYSTRDPSKARKREDNGPVNANRIARRRSPQIHTLHMADELAKDDKPGAQGLVRRVVNKRNSRSDRTLKPLQSSPLQRMRKARAARAALTRLNTFLSYAHSTDQSYLMRQGRYRSLKRRVFTLAHDNSEEVDLRQPEGRFKSHVEAFAHLDRRIYSGVKRIAGPAKIRHDPRWGPWAAAFFKTTSDHYEEQLWKRWLALDEETRDSWPYLLIFILHRAPGDALFLLRLLNREGSVKIRDPAVVADALEHLAKLLAGKLYVGNSWKMKHRISWTRAVFVPAFYQIFRDQLSAHRGVCSQDLLLNIANLASIEDLKRVFDLLVDAKANMLYITLLHYANVFAKAGEHEYALLCLKRIVAMPADTAQRRALVNRTNFRWTCALIIRKSMASGENYHKTTDIVAALLEFGVQLDTLLYNTIVSNAMEAGDYTTAFRVYNNLSENGLKPDAHTFSILLHGCTRNDDPAKFDHFAQYCAQVAKELRSPWLATEYLYYLYVRHARQDSYSSVDIARVSAAYLQFFTTTPLEPLCGHIRSEQALAKQAVSKQGFTPMEPPPAAVYLMLQAEIRKATDTSNNDAWNFYLLFRQLVQANYHPSLDELARSPVIWNAFLLSFCRTQQFHNASQLIKYMTEHSPQPNVYSWNIFMQGFFKTTQVQAAERVYEIMRSRGIEPDQFSYGTLLRGYLRANHIEKIGAVMEHVDNEEQMEPELLGALARVHDRKSLMLAMEEGRKRKEQKEEEEAKTAATTEHERWKASPVLTPILGAASFPSVADTVVDRMKDSERASATMPQKDDKKESTEEMRQGDAASPQPMSSFRSSLGFKSILPRIY
ncbi:hypothetical protein K458DRAFT_411843 [Lentithecium fluviatile CBS 122367]|uniref:Pentacotripeptide-repeat region of PRORP domain-containing protein n=1 Tax=Lentithecium fluviatile CBS 122367 TaxID=1168545 RepID=A0A6G1JPP1_9PLEO|nr:hypothetical protein K458DRAFT_411843 [Lentithecium fluviatile CBS 122367]